MLKDSEALNINHSSSNTTISFRNRNLNNISYNSPDWDSDSDGNSNANRDLNLNYNGLWMNESPQEQIKSSMSASTSTLIGEEIEENSTFPLGEDPSIPSPTFASTPTSKPLAFNGDTYIQSKKKERKGLYFISTSDTETETQQHQPETPNPTGSSSASSAASGSSGTSHKKRETGSQQKGDISRDSRDMAMSNSNINDNHRRIPTLKFSSPTSASTSTNSTDEDTLDVDLDDIFNPHGTDSIPDEPPSRRFVPGKNIGRNNNFSISNGPPDRQEDGRVPTGDLLGSSGISSTSCTSDIIMKDETGSRRIKGEISEHNLSASAANNSSHSYPLSTSTEENFECFGEGNESFSILESTNDSSLQNFRDLNDSEVLNSPGGGGNGNSVSLGADGRASLSRNAWQRTSLRKTPNNLNADGMNHKRWGSFRNSSKRGVPVVPSSSALASQLYRSSSYHSSGRSSAGDGEEMYSDSSLEGEVIDLTKKVHHLEEKFSVLAENQNDVDDRYSRAKQENAELSTKLFMLEEQIRDVEQRCEEKVREEQRRHKELSSRAEREKQLQIENYEIKFQMLDKDHSSAKIDIKRLEGSLERERNEKNHLSDKCLQFERELVNLRDHNRDLLNQNRKDRENLALEAGSQQALVELKRQLESLSHFHMNGSTHSLLKNDSTDSDSSELKSRLKEAEEEIRRLKQQNKNLQESNEELSAQILNQGFEDGRNLLRNLTDTPSGNSLAAEFEAMSNDETDEYGFASKIHSEKEALAKMKIALKDQKEANLALRAYIDGILLNIVEHYPQLLEVKNKNSMSGNGVACSKQ